jgi:MerR family copper efflux transcriptional regulator
MRRQGLLIGEVAARSGLSRKAIRLYEDTGILTPASRTEAGYRLYRDDVLPVLNFVLVARRLGFTLAEIAEIVAIRRAGQMPCTHIQARGNLAVLRKEEWNTLVDLIQSGQLQKL